LALKGALIREGHTFKSETDTEILSHLIQSHLFQGLTFEEAVRQALLKVQGSYAVAVLYEGDSGKLIAARKESPLILGLGKEEAFVASDIPAILPFTRQMIFLEDGEMAVIQDGTMMYMKKYISTNKEKVEEIILMTEKEAMFGFPDVHGKMDYALLLAKDPVSHKWCQDLFLYRE
jgi:glucosamine--fructose-6-phosphate aminotransferase (isomerizing)